MRKKFIIPIWIVSSLLVIYTILWYTFLLIFSKQVNEQFANKFINTQFINNRGEYYVKFAKIAPYGFPFKIGFKIIGWTEESNVGKIECLQPIYFGYDITEQSIFGQYKGEAIAWHKPLESKFGSKISNENYLFTIKLPLNIKILQILLSKTISSFELINFIEKIGLESKKVEIFDILSNEKLYDQDNKSLIFSFEKRKYYESLNDFLSNIPLKVKFDQNSKINQTTLTRRILPPNILFGLDLPFNLSGANKITVVINTPHIKDFSKDLEVYYEALSSTSDVHTANGEIIYKGKLDNKEANINLKANIKGEIKAGFFDRIFKSFDYLTNYIKYGNRNKLIKEGRSIDWLASNVLDRLNNPNLRILEDHDYQLNLDLAVNNNDKELKTIINDLSIFSRNTGVIIHSENVFKYDLSWHVHGMLGIKNQPLIIDLLIKRDIFGILKTYPQTTRELYTEVVGQFLKSISEYSSSTSTDLTLDYIFGFKEPKNGKIGRVAVEDLKALFDLALYKETIKRVGNNDSRDEKIQDLVPYLSIEKQKVLEKLLNNKTPVGQDVWNELIK